MNTAVLIIGGNIGDRFDYIARCQSHIEQKLGKIVLESSIYETAAWGRTKQQDYLNQAFVIHTTLLPQELLAWCQEIEELLDRKRELRWGERTLDIDIIFYNQLVVQTKNLEIPHPRFQLRNFVLIPLAEIIPDFVCPEHNKSIKTLKNQVQDTLEVRKISVSDFSLCQ